jgi:hypothetical protein
MATGKRQHNNEVTKLSGAPLNGALSPLVSSLAPAPARAKAGFSPIPFRHWRGRLKNIPLELRQFFLPLLPPHLERLQRGEIAKTQVLVPQVGVLTLQLKNNEVWLTFADALQWAYQLLHHLRLFALALRHRTFSRSPEGGLWVWLPQQLVFPPDCRSTLFCVKCQTTLMERSPPPWKRNDHLRRKTDEAPYPQIGNRWLDITKPRAVRAPTCAAR